MPRKGVPRVMTVKTMVRFPEKEAQELQRIAERDGIEFAALVRMWTLRALRQELRAEGRELEPDQ